MEPRPNATSGSTRRFSSILTGLVAASALTAVLGLAAAGLLTGWAGDLGPAARSGSALGALASGAVAALLLISVGDRLKRSEEATREGESRFTQVTDALREVVWLSTADKSALLYVGPAFEAIWERPVQDAYDDPGIWLEQVHPDDRERVERALPAQTEGGFDEEYRIVLPDGRVKWVRDRAFPVLGTDGKATRVAGIAEEVTRQKELETELLRSHGLRSVARLAAGVAHDFNNQLTVIQSHAQLLLADLGDSPRFRGDLEAIRDAARASAALTRRLLAFGRQQVLVPRRLAPKTFLQESLPLLRDLLPTSVELDVALPEVPLPELEADPVRLREALLNVISHSCASMPGGGAIRIAVRVVESARQLTVEGGEKLPPGRFVAFEIADDGDGIPDSIRSRLFEPFHRGVQASGADDGLALASAFGILQQSGGGIRVRTEPAGGTAFTLLVPAAGRRSEVR